jgi:hypothetical protein
MRKFRFRGWGMAFGTLLLIGFAACGGVSRAPTEGQAGMSTPGASGMSGSAGASTASAGTTGATPCSTPTLDGYAPTWTPPHAPMPGACTAQQVTTQSTVCLFNSPTYDQAACHAFEIDDANQACLKCMFSSVGAAGSAAVLVTGANGWIPNTGGCTALLDGDTSDTSCGARRQAADLCFSTVCENACAGNGYGYDGYSVCLVQAEYTCKQYVDAAACAAVPQYARCNGYRTYAEAAEALTDLFCGSGPPPRNNPGDGGAAGAAP